MTSATDSNRGHLRVFLQERLLFGNEPTPELAAIAAVYFVQGILSLARLAISFFFKDELGLSPAEVSTYVGLIFLPWAIKPAYGFISDCLPLWGYRRRSYLILSGFLGTAAWLALATVVDSVAGALSMLVLASLSIAIGDVIIDSLVVERARGESQGQIGSLQSLCWGVAALGGLITAYLSGWLVDRVSPRGVFAITAIFPLIPVLVAGSIAEAPISSDTRAALVARSREQIDRLWQAIRQRSIWMPTAFILLWQLTPGAESALFYFSTNELGFEAEFLGRVRLVTSVAALLGVWIYNRFLKAVPLRQILGAAVVLSATLGMTPLILVTHANRALGIGDRWFSLSDSAVLTVLGQISFMPVLVLAASLCPVGVEATLFALLMSIFNAGGLVSNVLGGWLTAALGVTETNFENLWLLIVIANLTSLLPLFLVRWLPAAARAPDRPETAAPPLDGVATPAESPVP